MYNNILNNNEQERFLLFIESLVDTQKAVIDQIANKNKPKRELIEKIAKMNYTISFLVSKKDIDLSAVEDLTIEYINKLRNKEPDSEIQPFHLKVIK